MVLLLFLPVISSSPYKTLPLLMFCVQHNSTSSHLVFQYSLEILEVREKVQARVAGNVICAQNLAEVLEITKNHLGERGLHLNFFLYFT